MKRFRVYVVLAVVCLIVLAAGPALTAVPSRTAYGQDAGPQVNCNGLSEADCQILKDSMAAMQGVTSFAVPVWSAEANLSAGPELMRIAASGQAAAVLPQSLMTLMTQAQGMDVTNLQPLIGVYEQLNSEMLMQVLQEMGLYLAVDSLEVEAPGQNLAVSTDIIYKDEGFYVRLESPNGAESWFGDVVEVTPDDLAEFDESIAEALADLQSEETQQALAQLSEFTALSEKFNDLVNQYVVTTRGTDVDLNGQAMAVFTTHFDLKAMLSDPTLPALVLELLHHPALADMEVLAEDLNNVTEAQIQFVLLTANMLLKDFTYTTEQWIGVDDQYLHKLTMDGTLNIDLSLLGADAEVQNVLATGNLSIELDDFGEDVMADVEVPAEYRPLEETDNFLLGSASMIEQELTLGQSFAAGFSDDGDEQDIYSLVLDAGQTVEIELASDDYPYLNLYGPDGFLIGEFDTYDADALEFTATEAGTYLVVVEAYWAMDYEITIRAQ